MTRAIRLLLAIPYVIAALLVLEIRKLCAREGC